MESKARSKNIESENMEPKMTKEGKYQCEADKKVFNTREEYDRHCSESHMKSGASKGW